jgi:hypothetical protein
LLAYQSATMFDTLVIAKAQSSICSTRKIPEMVSPYGSRKDRGESAYPTPKIMINIITMALTAETMSSSSLVSVFFTQAEKYLIETK